MVVGARDLPHSRRRRWLYHGAVAAAAALAVWWAAAGLSRAARAAEAVAAAEADLRRKVVEADAVAADCGLARFSDEASLESFPMRIPSFPTKREMECANRVSRARAALIEEHLDLEKLRPEAAEARRSVRTRIWIAGLVTLGWIGGLYVLELLPSRRGSTAGGGRRGGPPAGETVKEA